MIFMITDTMNTYVCHLIRRNADWASQHDREIKSDLPREFVRCLPTLKVSVNSLAAIA